MFDQTGIKVGDSLYYVKSFHQTPEIEKPNVVQELIVSKIGAKYIYLGDRNRFLKGDNSIESPWSGSRWQSWLWLQDCFNCNLAAQMKCNRINVTRKIDIARKTRGQKMMDDRLTYKLSLGTLEMILNDLTTGED